MTIELSERRYRAIVFDCDGVLADSRDAWARTEAAFCAEFGLKYTDDKSAATAGLGVDDSVRLLLGPDTEIDATAAAAVFRTLAHEIVRRAVVAIGGATTAVQHLGRMVSIGVASNTEQPLLSLILDRIGLSDAFSAIVTASPRTRPKPQPDMYLDAAAQLGVNPADTIVVEDSSPGASAAKAAGCCVIGFGLAGPMTHMTSSNHNELLKLLLPALMVH